MTIFEKIISGDIPGKFIYSDEICVGFADISPVRPGHALVVPREAISEWTSLSDEVAAHLFNVAKRIGEAQKKAFGVERAGLSILGFEVPHTHLHVVPLRSEADMNPANAKQATNEELTESTEALREALRALGYGSNVPPRIDSAELA